MNLSLLSTITFLSVLILYFIFPALGKLSPSLQINPLSGVEEVNMNTNFFRSGLFLLAVVLTQSFISIFYLSNQCGKNANFSSVFTTATLPWLIIMGSVIMAISFYPNLTNSFSDIVGYFFISSSVSSLLNNLMLPDNFQNMSEDEIRKNSAVNKILGNNSIMVNTITPMNFLYVWSTMQPLFKPDLSADNITTYKQELFNLIVRKFNVGEATWYFYTGLLVISFVTYNIAFQDCSEEEDKKKDTPKTSS